MTVPDFLQLQFDLRVELLDPSPENYFVWLEDLPQGRVHVCADQLLQSMLHFNRAPIDPVVRQKLLSLYLKKIKIVFPTLELELDRPEGVGHELTRKTALMMVSLHEALFQGFRICLAQRIAKPPLLNREQIKVELFTLLLESARETLLLAGMYHAKAPGGLWSVCYEVYSYMLAEGYLEKKYKKQYVSLGTLFKQNLLIGMLPQSKVNSNAFKWLKEKIMPYASQLNIYPSDAALTTPNGFYIELTNDYSPRFFATVPKDPNNEWRRLDCKVITDVLEAEVQTVEAQGQTFSDEAVLMRMIAFDWVYCARRRFPRGKVNERVWVQTQLGAIWELMNVDNWLPGQVLVGGRYAVHPTVMNLNNINDSGRLITGDPQGIMLRIGELIISRSEKEQDWSLGVIRWLMVGNDGESVDCGVEHLSYTAESVEVMPTIGQGNNYFMPALRLPAQPKKGKGASLVLVGRPFSRLRELKVRDQQGNEEFVRLTRLSLQTPFYQFAEFLSSDDL